MSTDPLNAPTTRIQLYHLAQADCLNPSALDYALQQIGCLPKAHDWQRFLDRSLLAIGATLLLVGILFFFAYNWASMNRLAKFGVLEIGILSTILLVYRYQLSTLTGQLSLFAAAILLGILLAVYGQAYQTGADVFSLFLNWAFLIIPWVLLGTFAPLWLLLLVLFNLSLILYWEQVLNPALQFNVLLYLLLFILNSVVLISWEVAFKFKISWLQQRWLGQLIFSVVLLVLIIPTLETIMELDALEENFPLHTIAVVLYLVTTALSFWYYSKMRHDLAALAVCLLGITVTLTTLIGKLLPIDEVMTWLLLALFVIAQTSYAANWLFQTAKNWETAK